MLRIAFVVYPGVQMLGLAAATAFEVANLAADRPVYEVRLVSEQGGRVAGSSVIAVDSDRFDASPIDTLLVAGGIDLPVGSPGVLAFLRARAHTSRRIGSICTGAFILAQAGLLDGRRATTHWMHAGELASRHPAIRLDADRIFTVDGTVWTSAGMTAGIDLALAMIEEDLGAEIARSVARKLVLYHRRGGGQSQHSELLELAPKSDRIQTALDYARRNLAGRLSVEDLAEAAHLSPRQFSRAFHAETGQSPAKAIERLRVEMARRMMEEGRHPIETVARETGFADRERMRRAFLRAYGQPPQALRRNAQAHRDAA